MKHRDRCFESHSKHGCFTAFFCVVLACILVPLRWSEIVYLRNWARNGHFIHLPPPPQVIPVDLEQKWNNTDGKTEGLGEKIVPVPLCPP
jgi:hypothetical protein